MSYEPFDDTLVIARLRDQVAPLRQVQGAADYAAVKTLRDHVAPCAYVLMADEAPGKSRSGALVLPTDTTIGVVLALRNYRERAGAQMSTEARTLIGLVRRALIGWQPPTVGATPFEWRGGQVMDYDDACLVWADAFGCTHVLQP
ncbi:hypothetical protein CKO44_16115 [Rubrivivax gelatinosus]|uniref:phage tail terminator protein n=1 Tax=Rubrivivax gelatinosus TaxID=28068 RepID=UPI001902EB34|nr:hypothetical protein [Rubrivivax gelatinosus]MBK1614995.1 hypothetical protein [Rubrivivax gelatinosus]